MACVALTSLIATIELEFLIPNHRVSLYDEKPLKSLFDNLSSLQDFLQKKSNKGGAPIRDLEIKIRDFALKAEDAIEIQLRNILKPTQKEHQELHQILREVAKDAEELLKIVNNKSNEPKAANDTHLMKYQFNEDSSPSSPNLDEDQFNEDSFGAVCEMLFHNYNPKHIVSIVGLPGVGKTTLAKRIYTSHMVEDCVRGWVTVPQEYDLRHILLGLLQSMRPTIKDVNKGSTFYELKDQLRKHLGDEEKIYFFVFDNMPNTQAWVDITSCLPLYMFSLEIRILLTTQFYNVGYHAASYGNVHEMRPLDSDRSWKLFYKRLTLKEHITPKFEEIGKHVVEECDGLPRSIVTVAERLSKCNYTLKDWKKIEKEVESLGPLYNDADHLSKLTLYYNQLPQHLKVCFLHFAIYPKRFKINVKKLIRIWIAEGYVRPLGHKELEKKAYSYLDELASKGLLSISKWEHKMTKFCWIKHSSLWHFCTREAKKEGFLCAVNTQPYLGLSLDIFANSCRWLSLYSHRLDYYAFFSSNNPRSLFFFQGNSETLVPFKLLRIVDLSELRIFERASLFLRDLVFLRYLSVPSWFDGLDEVVSNNQNLHTITISSHVKPQLRTLTGHLTSRIWELPHLTHIELGNSYSADPPNMVKEKLQSLSWVSPTHFKKEVYYNFPNLKYLKVFYKDVFEPTKPLGSCRNPIISLDYIEYLSKLETLTVIVPTGSVTRLELHVFPAELKKLRLSGTNFPVDFLWAIGQLHMLEVLKLENAINGRVWNSFGKLANLRVLLIEATNLRRWEVYYYYFPKLEHLILRYCYCLERIPRACTYSGTLEKIELEQCSPSVVTSAMDIQRDRRDRWKEYTPLTIVVDGVIQ